MLLFVIILLSACKKYLQKIPDESMMVPTTIADYRKLLDNDPMTNNSTPGLGPLGADDLVVPYASWQVADPISRNAYTWQPDIYQGQSTLAWNNPYTVIYTCNVVLNGLGLLTDVGSADREEYNEVMGTALFYRAFMFYNLEETFGQPYRPATARKDAGIPLRLSADPDQPMGRATVQAVFDQISDDLTRSIPLLPSTVQWLRRNRPCKAAAFALLARAFLTRQAYTNAKSYADSCLHLYNGLVDYDTVEVATPRPFHPGGNDEVLFQCSSVAFPMQYASTSMVDSLLYNSYDTNDLRKAIFFRVAPDGKGVSFRGQYTGRIYLFSGLANDEVYLIHAECNARTGNGAAALEDLNTLLSHRWKVGRFHPYTAAAADDALRLVLTERRKETVFRELRWADLRRLNQGPFAITLKRVLNGTVDTLPPNDPRYAYPIPDDEIRLSGIAQNPR